MTSSLSDVQSSFPEPTTGQGPRSPAPGLTAAFDPERFHDGAAAIVTRLTRYLGDHSVRGLDLLDPAVLLKAARDLMTHETAHIADFDADRVNQIVDLYTGTGIPVYSPGYMGRQFSGVVPLASLIDLVGSVVNQPSSFYEAGQLPSVAERLMAEHLNHFIGWEPGRYAMVTTSGGSLANMTALLAARDRAFPQIWTRGAGGTPGPPAIAVSEQTHYSVTRAAGVLGIGERQIIRLPADSAGRIRPDLAGPALDEAHRRGLRPFCLVASAGTTAMGAFDPLEELAAVARRYGLWLHVDGAHGASLLLSDHHRHKLRGIDQADSLTWDAHKMLFMPAPCTLLFYRDAATARGAFRQRASYVFDEEPDPYSAYDSADKNFECTKRPMIMPLWAVWSVYGPALFAQKIDRLCEVTRQAADMIAAEPDFAVAHRPESNILCFRYRPPGLQDATAHRLQLEIRNRIRGGGRFFISKVDIDAVAALRVVVMNHLIDAGHLAMLIAEIRDIGQQVLRASAATGNDQRNGSHT
ncbi:pyridoxal phosphate-dependent decarboxylase family protein [Sphaerisporangium corydalis]|uniref:Pyridoxal phosphate-dependent decarboxylase family protein n=1 Tax=Sphaerisporangium corydalis TaxID=1441875 RepID=A0ABV9EEU8_9ACTN|nr:pyridoxal-dependent decarboxylase [Sphaerisporangium corydalis]